MKIKGDGQHIWGRGEITILVLPSVAQTSEVGGVVP